MYCIELCIHKPSQNPKLSENTGRQVRPCKALRRNLPWLGAGFWISQDSFRYNLFKHPAIKSVAQTSSSCQVDHIIPDCKIESEHHNRIKVVLHQTFQEVQGLRKCCAWFCFLFDTATKRMENSRNCTGSTAKLNSSILCRNNGVQLATIACSTLFSLCTDHTHTPMLDYVRCLVAKQNSFKMFRTCPRKSPRWA